MESPPRPDPDFDPPAARSLRLVDHDLEGSRRVVINPFLAVLGLIGWTAAARWLFRAHREDWAVASSLTLGLVPLLIQYHCLDCGRTGAYRRLRRHSCAGLLSRDRSGRPSRTLLPAPWTQLVVWCYLIGSAALILAVSGLQGR